MRRGKRFLEGALAVLMCITAIPMDTLAAATAPVPAVTTAQEADSNTETTTTPEETPDEVIPENTVSGNLGEEGGLMPTFTFPPYDFYLTYGESKFRGSLNIELTATVDSGAEVTIWIEGKNGLLYTRREYSPSLLPTLPVGEYRITATCPEAEGYHAGNCDSYLWFEVYPAERGATPAPTVVSATATTITVETIQGVEYICQEATEYKPDIYNDKYFSKCYSSIIKKKRTWLSRKEIAMMNTVFTRDYLISERYEALSKKQSLDFMHPNKIMRRQLLCQNLMI